MEDNNFYDDLAASEPLDCDGGAYAIQELAECIKWLADVQIYQGSKECADIYNGDNACGGWYVAKINQTIAEKILTITEKMISKE